MKTYSPPQSPRFARFPLLVALCLLPLALRGQTNSNLPPAGIEKLPPEMVVRISTATQKAQAQMCWNWIRSLESSLRLWAAMHRDQYPKSLLELAEELGTPQSLICPADTNHTAAVDWKSAGPANISFEFPMTGEKAQDPGRAEILVRCPVHGTKALENGQVVFGQLAPPVVDWRKHAEEFEAAQRMTPAQRAEAMALSQAKSAQLVCDLNLKQLHTALRLYAGDHDDRAPKELKELQGELVVIPKMLCCPSDPDKSAATSWKQFDARKHLSYELIGAGKPLPESGTNQPVIRCPVHGRGIFPDGSVLPYGRPRDGSGKPDRPA